MSPRAAPKPLPPWAEDILATLPPLLSRERTRELLDVSESTLDRKIRLRELIAIKSGGRVVIPRRAVIDFLVARAG